MKQRMLRQRVGVLSCLDRRKSLSVSTSLAQRLLMFLAILVMGTNGAWADDVTIACNSSNFTSSNSYSYTSNGVTVSFDSNVTNFKAESSRVIVCKGSNGQMTISSDNTISSIAISYDGANNPSASGNGVSANVGEINAAGTSWTGSANSIVLSYTSEGSVGCRVTQVVVTTAGGSDPSPVDPTTTFSNGTYTVGLSALDLSTLFSSNSDGAVTYSVKNANGTGAEVNGSSFTATAAGTATVTATQAATSGFNAASEDATITVNAASLVPFSIGESFIADDITNPSSGATSINKGYYFGNKIQLIGSGSTTNTVANNKGSNTFNGGAHLNSLRVKQSQDNFKFSVSGPCTVTFYTELHSSRGLNLGTTIGGTNLGVQPASTSVWKVNIASAGEVYVSSYDGDFFIAGFTITETKNEYTVKYSANGGSGTMTDPNSPYEDGSTVTILENSFTRTGYTFKNWRLGNKETGNEYNSGQTFTSNKNYTLYAQWTADQYEIKYYHQGGQGFTNEEKTGLPTRHTYDTATSLVNPTKDGYNFAGWYTTSDCTGEAITTLGATDYTADITVYAKWTENTINIGGTDVDWNDTQNVESDPYTLTSGQSCQFTFTNTSESGQDYYTWCLVGKDDSNADVLATRPSGFGWIVGNSDPVIIYEGEGATRENYLALLRSGSETTVTASYHDSKIYVSAVNKDTENNRVYTLTYESKTVSGNVDLRFHIDHTLLSNFKSKSLTPVTGVSLNKTAATLIAGGATETLTATVAPAGATYKDYIWSTSDATKATVSSTGVVTPVAEGVANVIATTLDGLYTATCAVTVGVKPANPTFTPNEGELTINVTPVTIATETEGARIGYVWASSEQSAYTNAEAMIEAAGAEHLKYSETNSISKTTGTAGDRYLYAFAVKNGVYSDVVMAHFTATGTQKSTECAISNVKRGGTALTYDEATKTYTLNVNYNDHGDRTSEGINDAYVITFNISEGATVRTSDDKTKDMTSPYMVSKSLGTTAGSTNGVTLTVTAEDGTTKAEYRINLVRGASSEQAIANAEVWFLNQVDKRNAGTVQSERFTKADGTALSTIDVTTSNASGSIEIGGVTYNITARSSNSTIGIKFTVPTGKHATLYGLASSSGPTARDLTLACDANGYSDTTQKTGAGSTNKISNAASFTYTNLLPGEYTLTSVGSGCVEFLYLALEDAGAPVITTQPKGATYEYNQTATALTVAAAPASGGDITYEWFKSDNAEGTGATSVGTGASYTPATITVGTSYYYSVATEANGGNVQSDIVKVEVTKAKNTLAVSSNNVSMIVNGTVDVTFTTNSNAAVTVTSAATGTATVSGNTSPVTKGGKTKCGNGV